MNHWHFILGAYGVTLLLIVVEIFAARARRRAATRTAAASAAEPDARSAANPGRAR
jgi:Heme exporter protein D (CcmD)